jgi:glycosyltransferase involved in cell wall biosynthesis
LENVRNLLTSIFSCFITIDLNMRAHRKISFIYPFDPGGTKVGGVETFIRGFIKYAPPELHIEHIGITSSLDQRPVRVWKLLHSGTKKFWFYPISCEKDENKKTIIPLSLRFLLKLAKTNLDLTGKTLIFNRLEPSLLFLRSKNRKIGFVHNDIEKQLMKGSDSLWRYAPWLYLLIEKRIVKSLDYVYTVSSESLDFYKKRYSHVYEKFHFVPTWVDGHVFSMTDKPKHVIREEICRSHPLPLEGHWILFVGRLQKQKAPLKLIEAFLEYCQLSPNSNLIIIGEGNLKKEAINHAKQLGVYSKTHFLGSQDQKRLAKFYRASDVLVLTSNYEGMPRCCLEALGCGLPVVSTDVGETRRVVRNGFSGEIVEDFSPVSIARQIDKVVRSPMQYTSENCLAAVRDYTPQNVLRQVYELIAGL